MHYYQFHIGDYRAATAHLSNDEDLAYRRLLDMYYDTETPIPLDIDWVSRRLRLGQDVVQNVLRDMFTLSDDGWVHTRCDSEIQKYHSKADSARKANQIRWGSEKVLKSDADQILTNNHKPITNNHIKDLRPEDVELSVWQDFLKHRKTKKAEVTETVLKTIRSESVKAGIPLQAALEMMCAQGWTGFKSDWVKNKVEAVPEWKLRIK
jgi:uncharacterized protein YdaU (DUF1376 family)